MKNMIRACRILFVVIVTVLATSAASAQVTTGTPPFGSFGGGPDVINLANLNAHWTFPVLHKPGRGMNFDYDLTYDTSVWRPVTASGTTTWQPSFNLGWIAQSAIKTGYLTYAKIIHNCDSPPPTIPQYVFFQNWVYHDPWGGSHAFDGMMEYDPTGCDLSAPSTLNATAKDGSGYSLSASLNTSSPSVATHTITTPAGQVTTPPLNLTSGYSGVSSTATDRNGNQISVSSTTTSVTFTDTLGTTAIAVAGTGTPTNPMTFTYTAPSGATPSVKMNYTSYTVKTYFGISGISEYGRTAVSLVSSIVLPDNSQYTFAYEPTPSGAACTPLSGTTQCVTARLASVTLPTGGTISYAYSSGNNGIFSDGSTATLTRTTPDGTWTYARTQGTAPASTTLITDPQSNQTQVQFQGIYETQRMAYQGSTAGTLLQTVNTCYNGNSSPCTGTAIVLPIARRNITTIFPGGLQSEHDDLWNVYGAPTETDDYDFGAAPHGSLLKKTSATYATLGNINAFRQSVTIQDGNSHTLSQINYNYDEVAVASTSNTPQHVAVTTARGNLTSVNTYVNSTTYLTKSNTYYDTGNAYTATDVNGAVATYVYDASTSCGNSFATSINLPISGLTQYKTWNCTGGVVTSSTDENGNTTTTSYTDQNFWRPNSVTDPAGAVTYTNYFSPNRTETYLNFNGGTSTVDTVITADGLGRPILSQFREGPGATSFDTTETDYDSIGRVKKTTLPFVGTLGQTNSSAPGTTTIYDAFGRPLTVSDSGNGSTTYSYGQANDVLIMRSPAPLNEQTKRRQLEYDALGRLTSVCELTGGTTPWLGGNCAQTTAQTGYWAKYSYDAQGNLTGLTQNAQSTATQSRAFVYDWMSRVTSETVPETGQSSPGTTTFVYDSDATCGTYKGDLVKSTDNAGNVTCTTFDALHRRLAVTYPSGPYASATTQKHFVYDTATVNGLAMANTKSRLAEAYTCSAPCSTKITDIGFSYSARGEGSDAYESTPHSGSYYHVNMLYWDNGLPKQLGSLSGLPTISYSPDSEGRINSVSASSGQNLVSSTTYNAASLPIAINFGSTDSDAFTYDSNTNRMAQYQFNVGSLSLTSSLAWNANSTLYTQNIIDTLNSANTQNCTYQYDDLTRLQSANCGSPLSQAFAFDPFGNITKSGTYSFGPSYNTATNHLYKVPDQSSFQATYDNSGNVQNDSLHQYTWDVDARPITVDGVGLTYDALGRMVEQNRSGSYTQIVYGTSGQKLALFNGQTLQKALVPLSGNTLAAYNGSGLLYYGHADNLGSIRLASTPSRTMYFDLAYAPFGEIYAQAGTVDPAYTGQAQDTAQRQDTSAGLYDFLVREYSVQGRWPSPDPARRSATCQLDPQTQNRYAYVRNNPLSNIDPLGAFLFPTDGPGGGGCDPFFDPFCQPCGPDDPSCGGCDPFDPFCFPPIFPPIGPGGGGWGGGGREKPRSFPWPLLPLGFFRALDNQDTTTPGKTYWSCVRDWEKPKYFGICGYTCFNAMPGQFGFGQEFIGTSRLAKECHLPWSQVSKACPYFIEMSTASGKQIGGGKIESCQQEPN